jgi:hypothetical protein
VNHSINLIHSYKSKVGALVAFAAVASSLCLAQSPEIQQKIAEIKMSSAANKQSLSHYTWMEQQTISLKGDVKKVQQFQVRMGVDGQQQKVEINPQAPPPPSGGRLRQHVVAKKTDEFQAYGQQIGALGKQYAQVNVPALEQAYATGHVSIQPTPTAGLILLIVTSYLKPNDSVTFGYSQSDKSIQTVKVASYLDTPSDAVNIDVQFAKLPDGTNHVANVNVLGVSKQLNVAITNSAYIPVQ